MPVGIAKRALNDGLHCGDQCAFWQEQTTTLCIVDGLGHGHAAEEAALAAIEYVSQHVADPLPELFAGCDKAIRHTRGVAMGIAVVDQQAGQVTYAGINNTTFRIHGRKSISLTSNEGIVGAGFRRLNPETVPLASGDLVIMCTDGLQTRIDLSSCDVTLRRDVQRLADQILQDWRRETDDAAVLVYRGDGEGA